MTERKCPFCGKEMLCGGTLCRYNPDCPIHDIPVPIEVLELLERTRKALDVAIDALKIAKDCCSDYSIECLAKDTLEQITALEQKD